MGLFKGKKSNAADQPLRRTVRLQNGGRPDFVYYANRRADQPATGKGGVSERSRSLLNAPVGVKRPAAKLRRGPVFWFVFVAAIILIGQLTMLGGSGQVVLEAVGTNSTEAVATYEKTLDKLLAKSILNRSKITIDTRGIAAEFRRQHSEAESAVVTMPLFGSRPTLYVVLSEPAFVLKQDSNRYILSASGYITGLAPGDSDLPLVQDETAETVAVGARLLPQSSVQFMKTVQYQFEQTNIKISALVLPARKAYEIDARLEGKPYVVRFNLQEDAMQQSGAAIATIEQLDAVIPASYLDVRVPGRIYYK